jgi:uncharacterized membrane protein
MGYTAWVMNYGFPYQQRWEDMNIMYAGGPETNVLLKKYNISYVVIGSGEIYNFHAKENYFSSNFPLAFQDSSYRIYDVRKLLK